MPMSRREFVQRLLRGGAALGVAPLGYGTLIEPRAFDVSRFSAPTVTPEDDAEAVTFAFMSDFHRSKTTSRAHLDRAVAACNAARPDVVMLGGDYISSNAALISDCADAFRALTPPRGVFFVLGNHDHWHAPQKIRAALRKAGLHEVTNTSTRVARNVHLVGVDDVMAGAPDVSRAFRGTERGARVVLTHNPQLFPQIRERRCTVVCGHTHGGQIVIPFVPNPYLRAWKTYVRGWFHEESSHMYVNRGVGMLTLPIRFRCPPEITLITV
ncbi:MAG: metallophosphoesterase [Armatimonadetes bacterium]|nr:metallophosphoesterase [Armatimonadota bacterium]